MLGKDNLLPKTINVLSKRNKVPYIAILITGLFITAALFLKLRILVETASTILIITFVFSNLSVIILRESHLQNYQPKFHAPLYPWLQIIGSIALLFIMFEMGPAVFMIKLLLTFGCLFIYWFFGRIKSNREYAFLHLIERLTNKELVNHSLEKELKEIIQERDEIIKDRFDHIIEEATIPRY